MWLTFIIVLVVTVPLVALQRAILARRVAALMQRRSARPGTEPAAPAHRPAQEVPAAAVPRVQVLQAASAQAQASQARHALAAPGLALFRREVAIDLAGAALVFALSFGEAWIPALIFGAAAAGRYAFYVRQFRDQALRGAGGPGFLRRYVTAFFELLFEVAFHPRFGWVRFAFLAAVALLLAATSGKGWPVFTTAAALAMHGGARLWLYRRAQGTANRRLLILRVFNLEENADLTFGALRRVWQHIGSTFTVVDRSYIAFKYRGHSEDHLAVVIVPCAALMVLASTGPRPPTLTEAGGLGMLLSLLIAVGYAVAMIVLYARAPRVFATDRPHVQKQLAHVMQRPRRASLAFRELDMYCFDNTWRLAVAEFVATADTVLMDLRGLASSNKGCEFEINFLFDWVPAERVVFLVDERNRIEDIEQLLLRQWQMQRPGSPNLQAAAPVLTLYRSRDQSAADVRGLANLLAAHPAPREPMPERLAQRAAPGAAAGLRTAGG
jgi:hypothetical protein